ncbi:hypothetical protein WV31_02690 [Magnetospirillum sp. ME-1]|nr:hypothetical protein WV31_02690 [Magnetospirillum sp. ME-1]
MSPLHSLGDNINAKLLTYLYHSQGNCTASLIMVDIADQGDVQFHDINNHLCQHIKTGIARPKIIKCHPESMAAVFLDDAKQMRGICDPFVLSNLKGNEIEGKVDSFRSSQGGTYTCLGIINGIG